MKVFELMAALAYKPAGAEVVLYGYGEECNMDVEVVDYDKQGRIAISGNRALFDEYDRKRYDEPTDGDTQ